jgi:hypothetical protein
MRDTKQTIDSYITDMLALEEHIDKALRGQIADLKDEPAVASELRAIQRLVEHHVSDLRQLADARDARSVTDVIKKAGSSLLGFAAGAIDLVRHEAVPKNLRDDYTTFSLATIGYVMLHTTGLALDDREVAELAHQHFREYAHVVTRIHSLVPPAVVRYLKQEGLPAREDVLAEVSRNVEEAWRGEAHETPKTEPAPASRNL